MSICRRRIWGKELLLALLIVGWVAIAEKGHGTSVEASGEQTTPWGADESRIREETMLHFQAILRLDTSNPPGNEKLVVDYLREVLEKEGIPTQTFALDPPATGPRAA